MSIDVDSDDLATYLGTTFDTTQAARATMLITQAVNLALATVTVGDLYEGDIPTQQNLPNGAEAVILLAASRCYTNPTGATQEVLGPYSTSHPAPGVYLTRLDRRTLRRLAGKGGGAFTVDPTPADAMADYIDPLAQPDADDLEEWMLNNPFEVRP